MALLAPLVHGFRPVDDTPHGPVRWVIHGDGRMAPRHLSCLTLRYIRRFWRLFLSPKLMH